MESGTVGWFDVVIKLRGDRLGSPGCHHHVEGRSGVRLEADLASLDLQEAPPLGRDAVSPPKGIGNRCRIPCRRGPYGREAVGHLGPVTEWAVEELTHPLSPLLIVLDPGGLPERRLVPDVLGVKARQHCNPRAVLVAEEPRHRAMHATS